MSRAMLLAGAISASLLMPIETANANPVSNFLSTIFSSQNTHAGEIVRVRLHQPNVRVRAHRIATTSVESSGARSMMASFYGGGPKKYEPNTHTANGEYFNQWGMTAAHRTLPFGTRLNVCYRGCAVVRINDRGPATWTGRSLDLSRGAAYRIGMASVGSAPVHVSILR